MKNLERYLKAMQDIEMVGEEVSWSILGSEGRWYVIASHTGSENPDDDFKFSCAARRLDEAISEVAKLCWSAGPTWLRNGDKSPV